MLVICVVSLVTIFFWLQPSPPSGTDIQQVAIANQEVPPYPCAVTTQPLPIPVGVFDFTKEQQRPAREYKILVMLVSLSGFLCCLGYCTSLFLGMHLPG